MAISLPLQSTQTLMKTIKDFLGKLAPVLQGSPNMAQAESILKQLQQLEVQVRQLEVIKGQAQGTAQPAQMSDDVLAGGVADEIPEKALNEKQLEMGEKVEMEHTNDKDLAREIAKDHLGEELLEGKGKDEQEYYTKLKKVHEDKCKDLPAFWRKNLDYGERE